MGVSLYLVILYLFTFIHPSTFAQMLGHVTFSLSYVVVIVRGRLFSIGRQYEEAAADLGATPWETLRLVLLPLLLPAILSSLMIVFAISIDDFVISQWLSCGAQCDTIPIRIYSATRAAPLPSVNALGGDHGLFHHRGAGSDLSRLPLHDPARAPEGWWCCGLDDGRYRRHVI